MSIAVGAELGLEALLQSSLEHVELRLELADDIERALQVSSGVELCQQRLSRRGRARI